MTEPARDGCVLLLAAHHTAFDAPSGLRLLATTAELYGDGAREAREAEDVREVPVAPAPDADRAPRRGVSGVRRPRGWRPTGGPRPPGQRDARARPARTAAPGPAGPRLRQRPTPGRHLPDGRPLEPAARPPAGPGADHGAGGRPAAAPARAALGNGTRLVDVGFGPGSGRTRTP
ncbi:hypothetical protein NKH77_16625 [Streptomyces sp. M19]